MKLLKPSLQIIRLPIKDIGTPVINGSFVVIKINLN